MNGYNSCLYGGAEQLCVDMMDLVSRLALNSFLEGQREDPRGSDGTAWGSAP